MSRRNDTPAATALEEKLLEPYARFREEPLSALQELSAHIWGTGWRAYDRIVGQEIFYPGFSDNMKSMVLRQETLRRQITLLARRRVEVELNEGLLGPLGVEGEEAEHRKRRDARRQEIEGQLHDVAAAWTDKMICKMDSRYFIRGAYYLATQLLTRAYHQGIHVSKDEIVRLRAVAEDAATKKQSIIFLPCHRSHVDYVSLQLICFRLGIALPTVVAGDNLNFPLVGSFLQHAGAMWIRRSFGEDQLYPTALQAYVDTLLQNGHNLECFIEGGRSRTGKLLQPKFGILRFFLESVLSGRVEDAIICPVSCQYDKVAEVNSYISELLGQPKPKEDLVSFLSASNVLSLKLGRVDVRFHEPWSLRGFINEQRSRIDKQPTNTDTMSGDGLRRRLLQTLGYKVLADINTASVVMPTALVGTVLLTLRGRGVGKSELVRRVDWLTERVKGQGGKVGHFAGNTTETVVNRALDVLGPKLVGHIDGLAEDTFFAEDRFQLSFYRNMTVHLFVSQALVCSALYTKIRVGEQQISYAEMREFVQFLSQIFRAEFIFPTTPLEENLHQTLAGLERDGVVECGRKGEIIDSIGLHQHQLTTGFEDFDFYCLLLSPFIDSSWLGLISCFMLTPPSDYLGDEWLEQRAFQDNAQHLGKTLYHHGDLSYFEAINKESLKNALNYAEEVGIFHVSRPKDSKAAARVQLDSAWVPPRDVNGKLQPKGKLWDICQQISQYRREGTELAGEAVSKRVVGLADQVGGWLFASAVTDAEAEARRVRKRHAIGARAQL